MPGGLARDIAADGLAAIKTLLAEIRRAFPRLIELYDNTASLQDRTVNTGFVKPEYARQFGAGGPVGRASGRDFDARRTPGYAPYDRLDFKVPVLDGSDVNARVWVRIREVEQSLKLIDQIVAMLPDGPIATEVQGAAGEGMALTEAFRGDVLVWLSSTPTARSRAAICAMRRGFNGRCWRPRSRATSSPTSRSATSRSIVLIRGMTSNAPHAVRKLHPRSADGSRRPQPDPAGLAELAQSVNAAARAKLGRSLSIRQVDAGSCNGCELEIHALNNAFYDLERFGLHFVASPRHADVLMVTGPVTKNMREALQRTYNATPDPKWVIAVGACAADGGVFAGSYAVAGGVKDVIPVDLHIPGCPPSPKALLAGLLALLQQAA